MADDFDKDSDNGDLGAEHRHTDADHGEVNPAELAEEDMRREDTENSGVGGLRAELAEAIAKAAENLSGWKRAQADFENYRKRKESESAELLNLGRQAALAQLLPVLDSLEQALFHAPDIDGEKYKNWKFGLDGIIKQLDAALAQMGIRKIEAIGKKFDPYLHEAVREVPGEEDGIVAEQYQAGFTLNGNVIRPAQVGITKKNSGS